MRYGKYIKSKFKFVYPSKSLGEGLARVKKAFNIVGDRIDIPARKGMKGVSRLYRTEDGHTTYMIWAEIHKTKDIVPASKDLNFGDYDTYAGTVLRIRNSSTCGSLHTKPNQLMQIMRARFVSDTVTDSSGKVHKPIKAITDFQILNSEEGKPVVVYRYGKHSGADEGVAGYVKEIKSEEVPKEYVGRNMPDGNIVYYTKDTERDGKRSVEMKMYEAGIDVPIL